MTEDEAINILKKITPDDLLNCWEGGEKEFEAIETILDLYQKTKYELKGKEALVDTMAHNEEVLTRNYEILETKLQQEKEKNEKLVDKTIQYDKTLEKLQKDTIWKDKIKDMKRYREFELQQEYKEFKDDIEWKTYNKILKEE